MLGPAKRLARHPAGIWHDRRARRSSRRAAVSLCYHRVGDPPGRPGWELSPKLGTRAFLAQVRCLRATYRLVRASELLEAAASRRPGEPFPLALTFDDDYASHATVVAPALRSLGATGTFFLTGASLAGSRPLWPEVLQHALHRGISPTDALLPRVPDPGGHGGAHRLAAAVRALPGPAREDLMAALLARTGPVEDPGLNAARVRELVACGLEVGFHTREHPSLDLLDEAALAVALRDGRDGLEEVVGRRLTSFAFPFGLGAGREADAARAAGFAAAFTLEPRAIEVGDDPMLLARLQPSFASAQQTRLMLARAVAAVPAE